MTYGYIWPKLCSGDLDKNDDFYHFMFNRMIALDETYNSLCSSLFPQDLLSSFSEICLKNFAEGTILTIQWKTTGTIHEKKYKNWILKDSI